MLQYPYNGLADLRPIFFHELGHFIAMELNKELYSRSGVKSIKLIEIEGDKEIYSSKIYSGESKPIEPYRSDYISDLAPFLAELPYGCYYHYLSVSNVRYLACFKAKFNCPGSRDFASLRSELCRFGQNVEIEKYLEIFKEYFNQLWYQKDILNFRKLFEIEPLGYLIETDKGYKIKIDELRAGIEAFLTFHIEEYRGFVERIDNELKSNSNPE